MNKKFISLLMVICMFVTILTGCGSENVSSSKPEEKSEGQKITVTDSLGREVTLDKIPEKVVANKCALRLYSYVADTDKVVGIEQGEKKSTVGMPYMMANQQLKELPVIGQGGPNNVDDYEKILSVKPDVIFTTGDDKATVDKLQAKTGIPAISVSYGKTSIFDEEVYKSLETIGKVMGEEKRAEEVVNYMEDCKKDLNERTKDIPDDKKPTVYAGAMASKGSHGLLNTKGNNPLFNAANINNIADKAGKEGTFMMDKEKLLEWNPDKIIIDLSGIHMVQEEYKKDPNFYKTLKAFKEGEVYTQLPYVWSRTNIETAMVDAYYIGKVVYPEQFKDIEPEKKADEIYKFLVGKELYKEMAEGFYGGFQKMSLEKLESLDTSSRNK